MLTIEHNPTHMEQTFSGGKTALSEGKASSPEGENQLDGGIHEKDHKNDGLGTFAKLLAGLSKKTPQPETIGSPETLGSLEIAEDGAKKTTFLRLTKEKMSVSKEKDALSNNVFAQKKENRPKETVQNRSAEDVFAFGFFHQFPAAENGPRENQKFTPELVSLKDERSVQRKDIPERKYPFRKGEMPENFHQGEARNINLQSKKEEKTQQTESRQGDRVEARKAGRKRNTLEIHDLRTQGGTETGTIAERGLKGAEDIRNSPVKEIVVELKPTGERNEGPAGSEQKAASARESFEMLLARELRGDLSSDIVRQAAIILRDGGEGTIKLSLKPETLGKVKIHLEMAENRISGHIIVESEEALRAFEREIRSLEQSFRDSGFEASLNAALDYRNDGQRWQEKAEKPFYSERLAASYEESGGTDFSGFDFGISAVNMFA